MKGEIMPKPRINELNIGGVRFNKKDVVKQEKVNQVNDGADIFSEQPTTITEPTADVEIVTTTTANSVNETNNEIKPDEID